MLQKFGKKYKLNLTPSVLFWNVLAYVVTLLSLLVKELVCIPLLLAAFFSIAWVHDNWSNEEYFSHYWVLISPLYWMAMVAGFLIKIVMWFYDYIILPFNLFLNGKK